jgi:hypothetical protein
VVSQVSKRVVRWLRWSSAVLLGCIAASCAGRSVEPKPVACATDDDCGSGLTCVKPVNEPIIGLAPCAGRLECFSDASCAAGEACVPSWQEAPDSYYCPPNVCGAPCSTTGCPEGSSCGDSGACVALPCLDETLECPDHWRCDPEAAALEPPGSPVGPMTADPPNVELVHARGCVRLRCNEADGYQCAELFICDRAEPSNLGCKPAPCEEWGRCVDDTFYICQDQSQHLSSDNPPDPWGCVVRGCDEGGAPCEWFAADGTNVGFCDYSAPRADPVRGCAAPTCEKDGDCYSRELTCDPTHESADKDGCRYKDCYLHGGCPAGFVCNAFDSDTPDGCAPASSSGGASGTAGTGTEPGVGGSMVIPNPAGGTGAATTSGGTGSATGGTGGSGGTGSGGQGGSSAMPQQNGVCKPRR